VPACLQAMWGPTTGQLVLAAVLLGLAASSCTQERTFGADEFIDEVRQEGVELTLGEPLITDDESKELYALTLEPLPGSPPDGHAGEPEHEEEEGHEHEHGGGSLSVYDDNAGADEGMGACQAAADLLCYRAANIVVILESGGLEAQRLGVAMQKLEDG
jgi:hypothetical protein